MWGEVGKELNKGVDPSLQQLLETMCKQICVNAQSARELRGHVHYDLLAC